MATKNFRSTVLEPTSEFAHGDRLRFTALATIGEVLKGSFSETTIGEDGVYSVDLQYGKHRIDYKPYEGVWRHFADVEVNADTLATTLQDLALASVPVTDEAILVLQGILADAESAKTEVAALKDEAAASAEAAAESADALDSVISDSSFMKRYTIASPVDASGSGKYSLAMIEEYSASSAESYEHPLYSISAYGASCVHRASLIPQVSPEAFYTGNYALIASFGRADIRVFFGKNSGGNFALYFAFKNTSLNSAELSVNVSTYKKLTIQVLGAVNIDSWLADNPLIGESALINIGDIASPTGSLRMGAHAIDRDTAENYGLTAEQFDSELAEQQASDLFKSEKSIALQIMADFNLGTGDIEISGADIADVRAYIQSIDPAKGLKAGHLQRAKIPRPSIFDRYKTNPYEL